jgi:hypothetical protein
MCQQADANFNTCATRRQNMTTFGTGGLGSDGQADAFYQCQKIYQGVLNMCHSTRIVATRTAPTVPPAPKPVAPPQANKAEPPNPGRSMAPPQQQPQQPQMSAQCQQLVSAYVAAAQANDGPRALAGYNALKSAGGCGVLAQVDRPMPQAAPADNSRLLARGATPNTDQVVGGCDASPAECQRRVQELRAGVSPEAQAAIFMNAVSIGLQLGATVAGGMAATVPHGGSVGGGSNMNSIGNRPVQRTYGQGAPTGVPQRNTPSDITGTK